MRPLTRLYEDLLRMIGATERRALDVHRNAAAWIASRCRVHPPKVLAAPEPGHFDEVGLRSLPHLAALGYLIAAGGEAPRDLPIGRALRLTAKRAPHTSEGTGIADDPIVAVGLFLLAQQLDETSVASRLGRLIEESRDEWPGAMSRFLVGLARPDPRRGGSPVPGVLGVALALLAESGPPALRAFRRVGATADLVTLAETADPSADLEGFVLLLALHQRLHSTAGRGREAPDFYLAYASHERERAIALHAQWRGHLRIYADFGLLPGQKADEENPRHLAAARCVLVLVPSSPGDRWLLAEDIGRSIDEAQARGIPIVPIVESRALISALPYGLGRVTPLVLDEFPSPAAGVALLAQLLEVGE